MKEIYVCVDIETDGPNPACNSLLSIGAVAMDPKLGVFDQSAFVDEFSMNVAPLEGHRPDPNTEAWWAGQPRAVYEACRTNPVPAEEAMRRFAQWVEGLKGESEYRVVFVACPVAFDFPYLDWYFKEFVGANPFGFDLIDIQSYAMGALGRAFEGTFFRSLPEWVFPTDQAYTHIALDDAKAQGLMFLRLLSARIRALVGGAVVQARHLLPPAVAPECKLCAQPGGAVMNGDHSYAGNCARRRV